jgi:translocation and assembly module TamA
MHRISIILAALLVAALATAAELRPPEIEIEGLDKELRQNVMLLLSLAREREDPELTEERIRTLHAAAPAEIRGALEPFGYYRARVDAELVRDETRWIATYRVDPGPPLPLAEVELRVTGPGENEPALRTLVEAPSLQADQPLEHARYETTKRDLLDSAIELGYLDARLVTHELRVDLACYRASVLLHLDTGPRYYFGPVSFEQDFFDPEFLARFVPFKRGEPFSHAALLQLQAGLNDTEYFQQVEAQPRRDQVQDHEIPVVVALKLRAPNKYTFGIGYGTDTGARGKLGWERRLINREGHRFAFEAEISEIGSELNARYLIPVLDPRTDHVAFTVAKKREHTITSISDIYTLGGGLSRARGDWRESYALNYHSESFATGDDSGDVGLLMPVTSWVYTIADDRLRPRRGARLSLELRGAHEDVVSDLSFWQVRLGGRAILPLGERARLLARVDGGYTAASRFDDMPASLRFYAGGSQSVRGFKYQGIGPLNSAGEVVGGRQLLVGSIEAEQRLRTNLGAAVFYDIGKAYNDPGEPFQEGAGVGLRYLLPIGTIRVDVARGLTDPERPWRFHLWIGTYL